MAIAPRAGSVQSNNGLSATTAGFNCQANDVIVVTVEIRTTTTSVSSITDTIGNTYTVAKSVAINNGTSCRIEEWWVISTGSNTANAITVNISVSGRFTICAESYSGVVSIGNTNTSTGSSTAPAITLTTQDTNNWIALGVSAQGLPTLTATAPNVVQQTTTITGGATSSDVRGGEGDAGAFATAGSNTVTFTLGASGAWAAAGIELRSVAAFSPDEDVCLPIAVITAAFFIAVAAGFAPSGSDDQFVAAIPPPFAPDEDYIVVTRSWQSQAIVIAVPSSDAGASSFVPPEDDALVIFAPQPFVSWLPLVADEVLGIPPPAFTPDEDVTLAFGVPRASPVIIPTSASDDDALAWIFLGSPDEDYQVVGSIPATPTPWAVVLADEPVVPTAVAFTPDEDYLSIGSVAASPSAWPIVVADEFVSTPAAFTPDEDVAVSIAPQPLPLPWVVLPDDSIPAGSLSVAAFTPDEDVAPITRVTQWTTQGVIVFGGDAGASPTVVFATPDEDYQGITPVQWAGPILGVHALILDDQIPAGSLVPPPPFVPEEDAFIVAALPWPTVDWVSGDDDPPAGSLTAAFTTPDEDYQGITPVRWATAVLGVPALLDDQIPAGSLFVVLDEDYQGITPIQWAGYVSVPPAIDDVLVTVVAFVPDEDYQGIIPIQWAGIILVPPAIDDVVVLTPVFLGSPDEDYQPLLPFTWNVVSWGSSLQDDALVPVTPTAPAAAAVQQLTTKIGGKLSMPIGG